MQSINPKNKFIDILMFWGKKSIFINIKIRVITRQLDSMVLVDSIGNFFFFFLNKIFGMQSIYPKNKSIEF